MLPLGNREHPFATPRKMFLQSTLLPFFIAKEKSHGKLTELNLDLCDILKSSVFSGHIIHLMLITYSMDSVLDFLPRDSSEAICHP